MATRAADDQLDQGRKFIVQRNDFRGHKRIIEGVHNAGWPFNPREVTATTRGIIVGFSTLKTIKPPNDTGIVIPKGPDRLKVPKVPQFLCFLLKSQHLQP